MKMSIQGSHGRNLSFFYLFILLIVSTEFSSVHAADTSTSNTSSNTSSSTGSSINSGAKKGSSSQNLGTIINLAAGGTLAAICATESGSWACPMAVMSFLQAATQAAASKKSSGVDSATTQYKIPDYTTTDLSGNNGLGNGLNSGDNNGMGSTSGGGNNSESNFRDNSIGDNLKKLENMGYKANTTKGTIITPKGEMPMQAFSSPNAMAAAGMDPSQVSAAREGLSQLNKELSEKFGADAPNVVAMGVSPAGGGGSGSPFGEASEDQKGGGYTDPMAAYLASLKKKLHQPRGPASMAGMQKMIGGEPIGVKMDNIFEMIHRRYQQKRKANVFIE